MSSIDFSMGVSRLSSPEHQRELEQSVWVSKGDTPIIAGLHLRAILELAYIIQRLRQAMGDSLPISSYNWEIPCLDWPLTQGR
jgi:hypothetical protein